MTFDWQTEYARALQLYGGDTPSAHLEQELLDAFQTNPQAVTNAITKIGKAYAAGKIHSPWGALRSEIPKQITADVHVGDGSERNRAIANAEQFIRNAGLHYPTWTEVEDDLYERGNLAPWRKDHELKQRLKDLWTDQRQIADILDQQEIARANLWKAKQGLENERITDPAEIRARIQAIIAEGAPT